MRPASILVLGVVPVGIMLGELGTLSHGQHHLLPALGVYARVDHGGTIVLVLGLAEVALQTRLDLSADADAITLSDAADVLAHADCAADNLVADAEGSLEIAPAARHGVHIGAAHAAGINFDVDIVILKGLGLELSLVELVPCLGPVDAETGEGIGVSHFGWILIV